MNITNAPTISRNSSLNLSHYDAVINKKSSMPIAITAIKNPPNATLLEKTLRVISKPLTPCFNAIKNHGMLIAQFGPGCKIFKLIDGKCTPTGILTANNLTCFLIHCEAGVGKGRGFLDINGYSLMIRHWGPSWSFNNSFNPRNFTCVFVTEELEHLEMSYPFWSAAPLGFITGGQALFGIEIGLSRVFPKAQVLQSLKAFFSPLPTATAKFFIEYFSNLFSKRASDSITDSTQHTPAAQDEEPSTSSDETRSTSATSGRSITQQPIKSIINDPSQPPEKIALEKVCVGTAVAIVSTIERAKKDNDTMNIYWFNLFFGPSDINGKKVLTEYGVAEASLLAAFYTRFNFTIKYINGKFFFPEDIHIGLKYFIREAGSRKQAHKHIDKIKTQVAKLAPDSPDIHSATLDLTNQLHGFIDIGAINDIRPEKFIEKLAADSKCRIVVKNNQGGFAYGYDENGNRLKDNYFQQETSRTTYILGQENSKWDSRFCTIKNHEYNHEILNYIATTENLDKKALTAKIFQAFESISVV